MANKVRVGLVVVWWKMGRCFSRLLGIFWIVEQRPINIRQLGCTVAPSNRANGSAARTLACQATVSSANYCLRPNIQLTGAHVHRFFQPHCSLAQSFKAWNYLQSISHIIVITSTTKPGNRTSHIPQSVNIGANEIPKKVLSLYFPGLTRYMSVPTCRRDPITPAPMST